MMLLPEILLSSGTLGLILVNCLTRIKRQVSISLGVMLLTLLAVIWGNQGSQALFVVDTLSRFCQGIILILSMWVLANSHFTKEQSSFVCILLLLAVLGAMVIVSAKSWLLLYTGLELIALPVYALCVINHDKKASEAGLKYFVMGVIASILILYGISFFYLVSSSLFYQSVGFITDVSMVWYLNLAIVFLLAGMSFKFGLAPFHMWVPDIYQSAPISVVYWLAIVPKVAFLGMLIRLLQMTEIMQVLVTGQILWFIGLFSIIYGVLMATQQSNIRRLIAYASIAHMGFVMLPLQLGSAEGYTGSMIYLLGYVLTTLVAFSVVQILTRKGIVSIKDLRGISHALPHESFALLLSLAAMAGIPPLVGFVVKLNVFYLLIQANYVATSVIAVIFVAVSAYYYMGIVRAMYFTDGKKGVIGTNYTIVFLGGLLVVSGIIPQTFLLQLTQIISGI